MFSTLVVVLLFFLGFKAIQLFHGNELYIVSAEVVDHALGIDFSNTNTKYLYTSCNQQGGLIEYLMDDAIPLRHHYIKFQGDETEATRIVNLFEQVNEDNNLQARKNYDSLASISRCEPSWWDIPLGGPIFQTVSVDKNGEYNYLPNSQTSTFLMTKNGYIYMYRQTFE